MRYTDKTVISSADYWQLVGLIAIGHRYNDHLLEIEKAIRALVGEAGEGGHSGDALFCNYTADTLLDKLGIERGE